MDSWEYLFDRAMEALDSVDRSLLPKPQWTFGGGTALMLTYRHRISRDIDIFLDRPEWLTVLSPRVNDVTDGFCVDYVEDTRFLKLSLSEGEIDFIVAPLLTHPGAVVGELRGRNIAVETPVEIVAKKLRYRGTRLRSRDVIDLAMVCSSLADSRNLARFAELWAPQLPAILGHLESMRAHFSEEVAGLALLPSGERLRANALQIAIDFLSRPNKVY